MTTRNPFVHALIIGWLCVAVAAAWLLIRPDTAAVLAPANEGVALVTCDGVVTLRTVPPHLGSEWELVGDGDQMSYIIPPGSGPKQPFTLAPTDVLVFEVRFFLPNGDVVTNDAGKPLVRAVTIQGVPPCPTPDTQGVPTTATTSSTSTTSGSPEMTTFQPSPSTTTSQLSTTTSTSSTPTAPPPTATSSTPTTSPTSDVTNPPAPWGVEESG